MNADVTILVVEDDPAVAEALVEGIRSDGYRVHHEPTAAGAMAWGIAHHPHLAVLDVRLPDGSGFDIVRAFRARGHHLPIMMLTAATDEVDVAIGLESGADEYVPKPYRLRELLARIRALLRRAYGELSSADADQLRIADLVLDRSSGSVTRGGARLELTPTEFRLLVYLAQHAGQVLSRAQLIDGVWGYAYEDMDEKTVNVHVRRLRMKVEPDPDHPTIILTVPGLGYRVDR